MNVGDEELAVMREQEAGWPQTSSSARGPANEHPKMFRKKSEHFHFFLFFVAKNLHAYPEL